MDLTARRRLLFQMAGSEMLKKIGTYTLQADVISGNGVDLLKTILDDSYMKSNALVYVVRFSNNASTSSMKVDEIVFGTTETTIAGMTTSNVFGYCFRNGHANLANGVSSSVRATFGTVAEIYRADY